MQNRIGVEVRSFPINNGSKESGRREIAQGLSRLLADTYTLNLKTHKFHWNVTGPMFHTLHLMFEDQYNELWPATDLIAERIRALGFFAPGSYKEFSKLTSVQEPVDVPTSDEMIGQLVKDHETVSLVIRSVLSSAERANDAPTADLLTDRLQVHEKTAWMLRSLLAEQGAAAAAAA